MDRLQSFCETNGLPWSQATAERFATYLALLEKFNRSMNLIGPLSTDEIVDALLIDSLTAAAVRPPAGAILDVGTGAGLPGIPLAIVFDDLPLSLVEPRRKRATFLEIAAKKLGLEAATIHNCRIEEVEPARFGYIISKAFQPPVDWLTTASRWRADDGVAVCLTRPDARAGLASRAAELGLGLVAACDDTRRLGAPDLGETRAVYAFG